MSDAKISGLPHSDAEMSGWLFKWTNYLKGYQKRWFVLQNGQLYYYRAENNGGPKLSIRRRRRHHRSKSNQAEMAHMCRGNISLQGALIHTVDSCTFMISNGGTQTFHIKASSEVERNSWVTALELAKAKAIRALESEEDEEDASGDSVANSEELKLIVKELQARLEDMQTCSELIAKHGQTLQRLLTELEQQQQQQSSIIAPDADGKSKAVGERATLFRIACTAMINACSDYMSVATNQGQKWVRVLQHEHEQRRHLEEMVEQLARQHSHLEMAASAHASGTNGPVLSASDDEEDNEFYDCDNDNNFGMSSSSTATTMTSSGPATKTPVPDHSFTMNIPVSDPTLRRRNSSDSSVNDDDESNIVQPSETKHVVFVTSSARVSSGTRLQTELAPRPGKKVRRRKVAEKPNHPLNLWNIMKNCIGKDLSKIPMPVNFNEPLSMLQRLTEDYEYSSILDVAANCEDPCEQLAYVAAFAVSSYSTTGNRIGKPFNPLLGETYECDRTDDLGWRAISEQVSHHPPMMAQYCESKNWRCWQEFTMTSKFRGKYLQVIPLGGAHVEFISSGNHYAWRKVTTTVHNIIVGKLWMDHHGDMEIVAKAGSATGIRCLLKFIPYSYFSRDVQRRIRGCVMDANKVVRWAVTGNWDKSIDIAPVEANSSSNTSIDNQVLRTGPSKTIWKRHPLPPEAQKCYGFTEFAAQLNEMEEDVAPTDSRLRPDQRLMEDGQWDEANHEKLRLEDKQRVARRKREQEAEEATRQKRPYPPYEPLWFMRKKEDDSDEITYMYNGDYWECKERRDWPQCPDIF